MNKIITLALAVVLFLIGAFVGNKIGARDAENLSIKSGTSLYEEPTAYSARRVVAKNIEVTVLEKVKYGAMTMVYLNDNLTVEADNGDNYKLQQGSFFNFVGVNEAEDMVTIFIKTEDGSNMQLEVPKSKVYPVDEGEWLKVRESSLGEKWVRVKSSWYDNV